MSATTEAIALVDNLVKDKISKETATQLVDFVEVHQTQSFKKDIEWIKWGIGGLLALFICLVSLIIYLHSDTKAEMNRRFTEVNQRFTKIEAEMKEMRTEMKEMKTDMREIKTLLQRR